MLKVRLTAEELNQHVLCPTLHYLVIAEPISVFEVQQAAHQADGQTRPPRWAEAHASDLGGGAKQVGDRRKTPHAGFALEKRGHAGFNLIPGHAGGQHGQGVAQIDHGIEPGAEEIGVTHGACEGRKTLRFE